MVFVSYAPNCEDVPLWRALGDVSAGRYVDWGAEAADGPSVSRAFYDRGWRGVSIRPSLEAAAGLAAVRPRDTVFTASDSVPIEAGDPVHFLRIDADDQAGVLERVNLVAMQPWIVVVRAGDPACDAALAAAGYGLVLFDGLNRFYLARAQEALRSRLAAPANVTDDFVRAADTAAAERLAATEALLQATEARLQGRGARLLDAVRATGQARSDIGVMHGESAWLRGIVDAARDVEARLRAEAAWLHTQVAAAREERSAQLLARVEEVAWLRGCLADSEARVAAAQQETAAAAARAGAAEAAAAAAQLWADGMRQSLSWRLTRPMRGVRRVLGRLG